jgi:hypothetical protein
MSIQHPLTVKALVPVQLLLAMIAIPSGALFLYSPGGEAIGAQTILPHLIQSIPFIHDFTIVGRLRVATVDFLLRALVSEEVGPDFDGPLGSHGNWLDIC